MTLEGEGMALITCEECGRSISDRATACPGCGYAASILTTTKNMFNKLSKEQLWQKAYDMHYNGKDFELPNAIEIYHYIIIAYNNSKEADYARSQLKIIESKTKPQPNEIAGRNSNLLTASQLNRYELMRPDKIFCEAERYRSKGDSDSIPKSIQLYKIITSKYFSSEESEKSKVILGQLGVAFGLFSSYDPNTSIANAVPRKNVHIETSTTQNDEGSTSGKGFWSDTPAESRNIPAIPTHGFLVTLAVVIGLGFLGGLAFGSYIRTKMLIGKGDYEGALKASSTTFFLSVLVIIGVPLVIGACFLSISN